MKLRGQYFSLIRFFPRSRRLSSGDVNEVVLQFSIKSLNDLALNDVVLLVTFLMTKLPTLARYGGTVTEHNVLIARFEQYTHLDPTPLFPSFRLIDSTTLPTTAVYLAVVMMNSIILLRRNVASRASVSQ